MTSYNFGDVVLVRFPQLGKRATNQRPGVVVLDIGDADIVIAPITSQPRSQTGDIQIDSLHGSGLLRTSWIRLAKVATLLKGDVIRTLGRLSSKDRTLITQNWQKVFSDFVS